jgi:hypothetical protein
MRAISFATASRDRAAALRRAHFSFAKTCSIGLRSGKYLGRNSSLASGADGEPHCLALVRAEVVEHDDVAGL